MKGKTARYLTEEYHQIWDSLNLLSNGYKRFCPTDVKTAGA
jgi:hypothetical protein